MMWYYTTNGERLGPISQSGMKSLYEQKTITPETLVWQEGMENWQPMASTRLASEFQIPLPDGDTWEKCAFSGDRCRRSEMVQIDGFWISPDHKDEVVELLKEGGTLPAVAPDSPFMGNLDLGHLMRTSMGLLQGCWRDLAIIHLMIWLPANIAFEYVVQARGEAQALSTLQFGTIALNLWGLLATGAIFHMLSQQIVHRPCGIGDAMSAALTCLGRLCVAAFISGISMLLGFMLLIIPGIIAAVRAALVNPSVVDGGKSGLGAWEESWELTRGRFWLVFAYLLIIGLLCGTPVMIVGIVTKLITVLDHWSIQGIATTFATLPMIYMFAFTLVFYRELKAMSQRR